MTASLLTKDALSKLPADLREHIIVENENVYGLTLHMSIGDLERLVAPHNLLGQMRDSLAEAERQVKHADDWARECEDEAAAATGERDAIAAAVQTYLGVLDIDHPSDSPQAVALAALEELL
mgnify:CR=1 FL=1